MLTEKQLVAWENQSVDPIGYGHVAHRAIPELIAEVRALRKIYDAVYPLVEEWRDQAKIDDDVYHKRAAVVTAIADYEKDIHGNE